MHSQLEAAVPDGVRLGTVYIMHLIGQYEGKFGGHDPNSREFSHVPEF
jgi:hypothetical protein